MNGVGRDDDSVQVIVGAREADADLLGLSCGEPIGVAGVNAPENANAQRRYIFIVNDVSVGAFHAASSADRDA